MGMKKEWETEPNHVEWTYAGYKCSIKRHPVMLHLCGYVTVPEGHICHSDDARSPTIESLRVHGGVTFAKNGEIGFDCAHCDDLVPLFIAQNPLWMRGNTYRNITFVKAEVESLADQLKALEKSTGVVRAFVIETLNKIKQLRR